MKVNILDLIDFEKVDILLEGFNKTTGFVTAILDLEGNVLSKSGWRTMCTHFHRINPKTAAQCTVSDTVLANKMADGEKYHFYKCLNGLVDVAVPIVINGEHIANLFSGQFFFEEPDRAFFKKQAEKYRFDEKEYLDALEKVPVINQEKVKTAMDFLLNMTVLISDLAFQKFELMHLNNNIKESEEKFKSVFEAANVGKSITSLTGDIEVNEAFCKMLGYTREELKHKKWQDLTPEEEISSNEKFLQQLLKGEKDSVRYEKRYICKNKTHVWVDLSVSIQKESSGNPLYYIATMIDITNRKQLEEEHRLAEELFSNTFQIGPTGMTITRNSDGKFIDANESFCKMIEYNRDEIIGQTSVSLNLWMPEERKRMIEQMPNSGGLRNFEIQIRAKSGKLIHLLVSSKEFDLRGETCQITTTIDITQRKKAEQIILDSQAKLNETLENSNRARKTLLSVLEDQQRTQKEINTLNAELENRVNERTAQLEAANKELEAFSYSVSHDLRAPLRHINGFISLFLENKTGQFSEEELGYLNTVTHSATEMGKLIDALLSFSKLNQTALRKVTIDTIQVVKAGLNLFEKEIEERKIEIKINQLPETLGDHQLITQVWTNLISNAIKYTSKTEQAKIELGSFAENNQNTFFIKDNGTGFNMKYADKLFKVFQRLHKPRDFEGIGIGLANVNRIITRHGGRCWAEGELNKGAAFYFSLPNE